MPITEESKAVLLVLNGAQGSLSSHSLFIRLPRTLRTKWSETYLTNVVLPDLIHARLVEQHAGRGLVNYGLTRRGADVALKD